MTSRDDWLEWRARGIGASDVAGILGISPWQSPYSVWASKVFAPGQGGQEPRNAEAMRWGTLLESAIISETERRLGISCHGEQTRVEHPQRPFARCTVDAFYTADDGETGLVECKTTSEHYWHEVPDYYEAQIQWQLEVCGLKRAWLACLHNGRKLSLWPVEADSGTATKMLDIAERFWRNHVLTFTPPDVDGKRGTAQALGLHYGESAEGITAALDDMRDVLRRIKEERDAIKAHEAIKAELENKVKAAMKSAELATIDGNVVASWRTQERWLTDFDKLRELYPDVANDVRYRSRPRVFLLRKAVDNL